MPVIKLLSNMPVTKFPYLTIWLFCKRRPFYIFGQFRGPTAKIGGFAWRKK